MAVKTRNAYAAALKQAKADLARHNERGEKLKKAVDALTEAMAVLEPAAKPARRAPAKRKPAPKRKVAAKRKAAAPKRKPANGRRRKAGAGHPNVPAGHYAGLGVTKAYRKFIAEFGTKYSVPQIRDTLVQGGVKSSTRAALLTGLHSVRRRDRLAAEKAAAAKKKGGGKKAR